MFKEEEKDEIKQNEIFSFNIWLVIVIMYSNNNLILALYIILLFLPHEYLNYVGIDFLPKRYWFIAIPTHFFVSLVYFFFVVKGITYYMTDDSPIKEGKII